MMNKSDILTKIISYKRHEITAQKQQIPLQQLITQVKQAPPLRDFKAALKQPKPTIIAELKKASPSKGIIRHDFDPLTLAQTLQKAGANCLSILTDQHFFQGSNDYLSAVREIVNIPILRKDFIIDEYQVYQARILGADCILLIVAALTEQQLQQLAQIAHSINLAILVEVHDQRELEIALQLQPSLIGINNRNLHNFVTSIETTLNLLPFIPDNYTVVSESGINTPDDIKQLYQAGVQAFLIGEALMRADDPAMHLQNLLNRTF